MKRFRISVLFVVAALSIAAVGSAALSTISLERTASGQVLVDTDENVAVQITNISNYTDLVKTQNGKVSVDLNAAINNNSSNGFNTDALFTIGTSENGVVKIKNNSDIPVTVTISDSSNAVSLMPVNGSSNTIEVGRSGDFYFQINTNGQGASSILNAVIRVQSN